ncbi:MAG TPA: DUF1045 domain-containing protein [Hyphomicrobiaceae bacterium]|nr:DUF1045 domain-containing protein [Hyphomicrobiaceae bacterium]
MSNDFDKYAVYWVPKRTDALARFGAAWTGWCAEHGEHRTHGTFSGISFDTTEMTRHTRRHGFHAVIKQPFHLGATHSFFALEHVLGLLVEESVSFQLPRLRLAVVDGCVALVPSQTSPALSELVTRIGDALGQLDAPANGFAEAAASVPQGNGVGCIDPVIKFPTAVAHRFHMPLTDPIGPALALEVMEKLQPVLEPILQQPRQLNDIALMGDPGEGRPLRVLQRYDLRDWLMRKTSGAMPCQGPHVLVSNSNDPLVNAEIAI